MNESSRAADAEPMPAQTTTHDSPDTPSRSEIGSDCLKPLDPGAKTVAILRAQQPLPRLPGYDVVERLARGGMGIVFRAKVESSGNVVAIKMIPANDLDGHKLLRLCEEAEAVRRLSHPNIVQILDVGEYEGEPYLVLEYVDGGSLQELLRSGRLPPDQAVTLVRDLARIMHYIHSQGIVHRDLKPGNVLRTRDGVLKVTDFGIARMATDARRLTYTGVVVGTPAYMAPEQIRGQRHLGPATDVYAMGVILYELLTGRVPFEGDAIHEVMERAQNQPPTPLTRLFGEIPRAVETICLKCLAKEPEKRYGSAEALADDLDRYLKRRPIHARSIGWGERTWRWSRRNPLPASLAAVLLFTIVLASLGSLFAAFGFRNLAASEVAAREEADRARFAAERSLRIARSRESRLTLENALSLNERGEIDAGLGQLVRSLEIAESSASPDLADVIRLNLANWMGERSHCIQTLHEKRPIHGIAISPDGATLATGSLWAQLWDARGSKLGNALKHTILGTPSTIWSVDFDSSGRYMATSGADGTARLWDMTTRMSVCPPLRHGTPKALWDTLDVWSCRFAPDGRTLLTTCADRLVRLFAVPSGRLLSTLRGHESDVICAAFHPSGHSVVTGSRDGAILSWKLTESEPPPEILLCTDYWVESLAFSSRGDQLAVGSGTKAYILDLRERGTLGNSILVPDIAKAVTFAKNDEQLLIGTQTGFARFWSVASHKPLGQAFWIGGPITKVTVARKESEFLIASVDGTASLWSMPPQRSRKVSLELSKDSTPPFALRLTRDGEKIVAVGMHGPIHTWHQEVYSDLKTNLPEIKQVFDLSPDGGRIAASCVNPSTGIGVHPTTVHLLDASSGKELCPPIVHPMPVKSICFAPDGKSFLTGCNDGMVRRFHGDSGVALESPRRHGAIVTTLCFNGRGDTWASAGDRHARVWHLDSQTAMGDLVHAREVTAATFDSSGDFLFTGTKDGSVTTWNIKRQAIVSEPIHHPAAITSLAVDSTNRLLAVGSADGCVRFWDRYTQIAIGPAMEHGDAVHTVLFHPSEAALLTGTRTGSLRLWKLPASPLSGTLAEVKLQIGSALDSGTKNAPALNFAAAK